MNQLELQIANIVKNSPGQFGIAIHHLESNTHINFNENEQFASASLIKVPILIHLYRLVDEGKINLADLVELKDSDKVGDTGILQQMHAGMKLNYRDLAVLMITISDNSATNMLLDRLGMDAINDRIKHLGLKQTSVGRYLMDFEAIKNGRNNYCSAEDMRILWEMLAEKKAASEKSCEDMLDILKNQQYKEKIGILIPGEVPIAAKGGSIPGYSHDTGILYGSYGHLIVCVLTRGINDLTAEQMTIARITRLAHDFFESYQPKREKAE